MEENTKELLAKWANGLGLQDWVIELEEGKYELKIDGCAGCTEWTESNKTALIQLIHPDAYGERIVPYDKEKTLVHELLHLKFCLLGESGNDLQDRLVHQLIDDLAKALVEAKRWGMQITGKEWHDTTISQ